MMAYANKFVAAVKVGGKVLREFKDTIRIPFGSEYSILLKNLNTTRALVNVCIDGEDIVPGGLVIRAGQEIDLERSIRNGNLTAGNRLKFVERTAGIEQHRGVKLEDGIVRVEFQFERDIEAEWKKQQTLRQDSPFGPSWGNDRMMKGGSFGPTVYGDSFGTLSSSKAAKGIMRSIPTADMMSTTSVAQASYNDAGITVAGSKSDQSFSTTTMGVLEPEKHSIVFKLVGATPDNEPILEPVTVKSKPKCPTCGRNNKVMAKFCSECGTSLETFA